MSSAVFPTLPGLAWPIVRTPMWSNTIQTSASGKETALALWSYPRWSWELTYNYLRSASINGIGYSEMQTLAGFFNSRMGRFDTFLYQDAEDNTATGAVLGVGDGVTTTFQLARSFGNFIEPILAPHVVSNVYVNGVNKAGHWTVSSWGSAVPGLVTLDAAPSSGQSVTADFTFYFPCRFTDDTMSLTKFLNAIWKSDTVKFQSVK